MEREKIREIYDSVCKAMTEIELEEYTSQPKEELIEDAYNALMEVYTYFVEEFDFQFMFIITTNNNAILHSDNRFYHAYIQMNGCSYCAYKRKHNAQKRLEKISTIYTNLKLKIEEI